MCYFISIGINEKDAEQLKNIVGEKISVEETKNPSFLSHLEKGMKSYTITDGSCSCNLYSWQEYPENKGLRDDLLKNILELLQKIEKIILGVHWYGGDIEKEEINFTPKEIISSEKLVKNPKLIAPEKIFEIINKGL